MEHSKNTQREPNGILKMFLLLLCIVGTSVFNQALAVVDQSPIKVIGVVSDELNTPLPGAYFMIYVFCICLIFSMVFIDNQLFNFYKFSSVLMVFAQNVVDLL